MESALKLISCIMHAPKRGKYMVQLHGATTGSRGPTGALNILASVANSELPNPNIVFKNKLYPFLFLAPK